MTTPVDETTITTVPTTTTDNAQTLLEMAISERMKEIHAAEEKQRHEHEAKVAEDRAEQQQWLEDALPADIRQTLGIELTPDPSARRAHFTFDGNTWSIAWNRHGGLEFQGPNGHSNYSYHAQDNVAELLAALGTWRESEAQRQAEQATAAAQEANQAEESVSVETPAKNEPHTIIQGDLYCVVLNEKLTYYPDDLTLTTVLFNGRALSLRRNNTQDVFDENGQRVSQSHQFDLSDAELDGLIAARESYRAYLATQKVDYDDVPF